MKLLIIEDERELSDSIVAYLIRRTIYVSRLLLAMRQKKRLNYMITTVCCWT